MELRRVQSVTHVGGHSLDVVFTDGKHAVLDVSKYVPFEGVFSPLRDETELARAYVDEEAGVIAWPNGADLDADALYSFLILGKANVA